MLVIVEVLDAVVAVPVVVLLVRDVDDSVSVESVEVNV
jgi:hypothetical protein